MRIKYVLLCLLLPLVAFSQPGMQDWSRFRGPNGLGISDAGPLPTEFGPEKNVEWTTPLPPGHSSPIVFRDRLYVTAVDGEELRTYAVNRADGKILWQKTAPRPRKEKLDQRNNPAAPSPAADAGRVVVFFPDFGLLTYDHDGEELWRMPLGPFNNVYGMGASPVLTDDSVILVIDQTTNSYIMSIDKVTGKQNWKTDRPEATSGHCTPVLSRNAAGELEIILPGSFYLSGYDPKTGERTWWVEGLNFEMKSTPVLHNNMVYINGYGAPFNQPENQVPVAAFEEIAPKHDTNGDGMLSREEAPDRRAKALFGVWDLSGDGQLDAAEWKYYKMAAASKNGILAIAAGGKGDMTAKAIKWQYHKSVPQLPSPLLYNGVLYMVNDGGIVTSFKPETGEVIAKGRLKGAVDAYYASPVAGDGKVYMTSRQGKIAVLSDDGSLDILAVNDMGDQCYATPAIADGRLYVRTRSALHSFSAGSKSDKAGDE